MSYQEDVIKKNALNHTEFSIQNLTNNSDPKTVCWPEVLTIRITSKCNLNCCMCSRTHNPNKNPDIQYRDISDGIYFKIEPFVKRVNYIIISGGEPTVAKNFLEKIRRIKQLNPRVKLKINTNGLLFSSMDFAESMIELFDYIYMSLHGVDSYAEISGGYSFEKIRKSLDNIKRARKQAKNKCYFAIAFVLMRRNIKDIAAAAELAKEMEADAVFYRDMKIYDESMKYDSVRHNPELLPEMLKEVQKAAAVDIPVSCDLWDNDLKESENLRAPVINEELNIRQLLFDNQKIFSGRFKNLSLPCYHPWGNAIVTNSGNINLCCNGNTAIGNLKEKTFEEIWLGNEAKNYRDGMITGNYYKDCRNCRFIIKDNPESHERKYIYNKK